MFFDVYILLGSVAMHRQVVVGSYNHSFIHLLQTFHTVYAVQWKNFENRSIFRKDIQKFAGC